jgi:hypothetical protein
MQKFGLGLLALAFVIFPLAAAAGIWNNNYFKSADMPTGLRYHITVNANIWPDQFYSNSYDMPQPRSLYFNGYWTFEPGKHLFAGPLWVYHPSELTLEGVDFTVNNINS